MIQTRTAKDGSRRYRVRYEHAGREHQATFHRLEDARAFERTLKESGRSGAGLPAPRSVRSRTIASWWKVVLATRSVEATTLARYESLWRVHVEPEWGKVAASKVTSQAVRAWVAKLLSRGLSAASAAQAVSVLSLTLTVAIEAGVRVDNPTAGTRPRPAQPLGRAFTPAELRRLIDAAGPRDGAIILLAAVTGVRFGELIGLRVGDVDLDGGVLHVRRAIVETASGRQVEKPYAKNGERRSLGLPDAVGSALRPLTIDRPADAVLWPSSVGRPRYYRAARNAFRRLQRDAGIEPVQGWHALRRTAATLALQHSTSLKDVQSLLGHKSPYMTMARYAIPDLESQLRGTSRVADTILGTDESGQNPAIDLDRPADDTSE